MDDLVKCLYDFVQNHSMGGLYEDEEYKKYTSAIKLQEEHIREYLPKEQREELGQLVDTIAYQDSIECEHLFRATLALSRELSALVS